MKKFLWLMAFVSLFALGHVMTPISQAQMCFDGNGAVVPDANVTSPQMLVFLGGQTPSIDAAALFGMPADVLAGNVAYSLYNSTRALLDQNALATANGATLNLGSIIGTGLTHSGVYVFNVTYNGVTQRVTVYYIPFVSSLYAR